MPVQSSSILDTIARSIEVGRPLRAGARRHSRGITTTAVTSSLFHLRGSALVRISGMWTQRIRGLLDGPRRALPRHCHPRWSRRSRSSAAGTTSGLPRVGSALGELICKLVPPRRWCASPCRHGGDPPRPAHRARLYGHPKVVKLHGHFHGWHDGVVAAVNPPSTYPCRRACRADPDQLLLAPPTTSRRWRACSSAATSLR